MGASVQNLAERCDRQEHHRAVLALEDGALRLGLAHTLPTIHVIGQVWEAHPDRLPFPSQELIAERIGRCVRTVRRHLADLERAGLLQVFRSAARRLVNGRFTRQSNRYLFRDRVARALKACPVPRKRRSHLEDISVLSPPPGGAEPAPPPKISASRAPDRRFSDIKPPRFYDQPPGLKAPDCPTCGDSGWVEMGRNTVVECDCR